MSLLQIAEFFQRYGSMTVAMAALVFTIGTFWWNNWRRGELVFGPPRTYIAHSRGDDHKLIIPIMLRNTGARTIGVTALRLLGPNGEVFDHDVVRPAMLLTPANNGKEDFAINFAVKGREIDQAIRQFRYKNSGWSFSAGDHYFALQALQDDRRGWKALGRFMLTVTPSAEGLIRERLITYDNPGSLRVHSRRWFR